MTSISSPLALNSPQSLAASSGSAVMVKPALEILSLGRRSCAWAPSEAEAIIKQQQKTIRSTCRKKFLVIRHSSQTLEEALPPSYLAKSRLLDNLFVP